MPHATSLSGGGGATPTNHPRVAVTGAPATERESPFEDFLVQLRTDLERFLGPWLDQRVEQARRHGQMLVEIADSIRELVMRGGKRLRPALLAASYESCGGEGGMSAVASACVAFELLQAYFLIHDDWMDGDDVRRGGPSVPALMRKRFGHERGGPMTILAGDLAAAWSRRALHETSLAPGYVVAAAIELAAVEEEVVLGQALDVGAGARSWTEVERMHALKSASYSVRGPVVVGARLASASEAQTEALRAWAEPLGVAFQLRDDLLGVFGVAAETGKPTGGDLINGKRSAVLVEAAASIDAVRAVLGRPDATRADIDRAMGALEASGVRERIEARIDTLVSASVQALERAEFTPRGRLLLHGAVRALTHRRS